MNTLSVPPVPTNLLEGLGKLGSAIVGLSVFAYIAGFVKLMSMYESLNAGWVIDFAVTQDILRAGLEPLAMVGVTCAASTYIFFSGKLVTAKIVSFLLLSLTLIFLKYMPTDELNKDWMNSYKFSKLICYSLYLIAGTLVTLAVFQVCIHKKLNAKIAICFLLGALFALYITPLYLGKVWGSSILSGDIKLPKAVGEQYKTEQCYLLGNINSKYAVACIESKKIGRIQLIEIGKELSFTKEKQ
ncbi:hypothetical protein [Pseudomonas sp. EA_15y_Pfl1_P101]|uniref:hypothetical protein n=1 Tax=Pseudomonas sp. EA_15y_Pfl1_P101 TaxID=3088684 RepID=UPI0030DCB1B9